MGLDQAGAGASIGLYDSWPCGLYQQTRGSARWALPLFVSSEGKRPGERGHPSAAQCAGPRPTLPPPACGPTPLPTLCGGGAAARPVTALQAVPGNVAAKAGQARPGQVGRLRCSGAPFRAARPSPQAGRFAGLAPLLPLAGCGVGAPARPGPHDVGAMGPSAPPARAAALRPALPARPRLRRRPCRAALPPHSPHGVAAPRGSRWPASGPRQAAPRALGRLKAAVRVRCPSPPPHSSRRARAAIYTAARTGGASAAFPALRARRGAGVRRLRAGMPPGQPAGKAKASAVQAGQARPRSAALPAGVPGGVGNRGGCPALWRVSRPFFILSLGVLLVVLWAVACRPSPSAPVLWLWAVPAPASGCVLRSGACVAAFGWGPSRSRRGLFASRAAALRAFSAAGGAWALPGGSSAAVRRRARFALVRVSLPAGCQRAGIRAVGLGRWFPAQGWRCKV